MTTVSAVSAASGTRRGALLCGSAALLFGAATPAAAELGRHLGAFVLAGLLYVGAGLATAPIALRRRSSWRRPRGDLTRLSTAVVFGGLVGPVALMLALRRAPASTVSLLLNFEVVFTVLLAAVVFHEHLGRRVLAGTVAVAAAGAVLGWAGDVELRTGALLAVAACGCWAVDNTVTANLTSFNPTQITFCKGVVAGAVNLVIGLASSNDFQWTAASLALVVGAVGYGASIVLWITGARELGAARGQLVFSVAPFVGALASWWVLGDRFGVRSSLALVLAVVGIVLVLRSAHSHTHSHPATDHDHEHSHDDGHHAHHHEGVVVGRHSHPHHHDAVDHEHPHVPDVHHRHTHA